MVRWRVTERARTWRPDWPCPVGQILGQSRRGPGDPTYRIDGARHWRGLRTPDGPASLLVEPRPAESAVEARALGPGASWALDSLPGLLGADDDPSGFEPRHPLLEQALRHHPHWRLGRTGLVLEALVPAIIEQKVTGQEAFAGFRRLVQRYGERAPGPGADLGLWVQPHAGRAAHDPVLGVAAAAHRPGPVAGRGAAAAVAGSLERIVGLPADEADRRLRSLPGVGRWTSAEVRSRALGDADAVSLRRLPRGDGHRLGADAATPMDDDELEELLEPWRPHRGRVTALVALTGPRRPRRGPRMAPRSHLPAG